MHDSWFLEQMRPCINFAYLYIFVYSLTYYYYIYVLRVMKSLNIRRVLLKASWEDSLDSIDGKLGNSPEILWWNENDVPFFFLFEDWVSIFYGHLHYISSDRIRNIDTSCIIIRGVFRLLRLCLWPVDWQ